MRGNVWITFLCEGPRHAPPPALAGGGLGRREPLPQDHRLPPPLSPGPPLTFQGFLWTGFPCKLQAHLPCSHCTSPFCGAPAPVCLPPCHVYEKRSLLSALTVSLPVSPPNSWVIPCLLLQRLQLNFTNSVLMIK